MYGMVGSGGGGGGGGGGDRDQRSSSTRSRRSLRDQQAKRSLRNYRQASTMSLYERGSLKLKQPEESPSGQTTSTNYRVIMEDSGGKRESTESVVIERSVQDLNLKRNDSKEHCSFASKLSFHLKKNEKSKESVCVEEERTPQPSPTHDIYCCSNISENTLSKTKEGDISNCCGVRYYHNDMNCEAYVASPHHQPHDHQSQDHESGIPHYHHYEHNYHHLISIIRRILRIIKEMWTGVKFGSDLDLEEIEQERRYRPERLSNLCKSTHFTKGQIQRLYRSFKEFCPTGVVTEDSFREMYSQIFPRGAITSQYATFVFSTLDTQQEGVVSFEAFITLLSKLTHGTQTERLRWIFSLYDLDDDGCITKEEMAEVVKAVFDLLGKSTDQPIEDSTVSAKVDELFRALDINQDGVITVDEFVDACINDANILRNLDMVAESLRP